MGVYRVATTVSILLTLSFVFQLIALLSVPIMSRITLCSYNGYKFGVFGLCDVAGICSNPGIGYSDHMINQLNGFSLPSRARHSISNLLVVHPISTVMTFLLLVMSLLTHLHNFAHSRKFLLFSLIFSLPTFMLCLLSFLVDILLFIPHLTWAGWLILVSTVLIAMSSTILCIMRRNVSSRKGFARNMESQNLNPYYTTFGTVGDPAEEISLESKSDEAAENLLYNPESERSALDVVGYRGFGQDGMSHRHSNEARNTPAYPTTAYTVDDASSEVLAPPRHVQEPALPYPQQSFLPSSSSRPPYPTGPIYDVGQATEEPYGGTVENLLQTYESSSLGDFTFHNGDDRSSNSTVSRYHS